MGPSYDEYQILSSLKRNNLTFTKEDKISSAVSFIDQGKSVGWFQGKSELGPRGLGNRSILCRADDLKFKDMLNKKVKHREPWRPFCPTLTEEKSDAYLENPTNSPYMILGYKMKHADDYPAAVHIDGTTRPQTINSDYNADFYNVVKNSGGLILNTSLNLAGDPTNLTPEDAIRTFRNSQLDVLVIGDYIITR